MGWRGLLAVRALAVLTGCASTDPGARIFSDKGWANQSGREV